MMILIMFPLLLLLVAAATRTANAFALPHHHYHHSTASLAVRRSSGSHFPCERNRVAAAASSPSLTAMRSTSSSSSASSSVISSNVDLLPGIDAIDAAVTDLYERLESLREQAYFRLYSVDILASCEYMPQELFECYTETCEIYPVDEEDIPEEIRAVDAAEHDFELDGWARWDMPSDDYYDIEQFPEGYTNYDGSDVWDFIHNKICFHGYEYDDDHWKADFNKAVSGLHAVVSAQVVRGIREKVAAKEDFDDDEIWRDPAAEYQRRLSRTGETPLAVENLYFFFMLLLTAVSKAKQRLLDDCRTADDGTTCRAEILQPILDSPLFEEPAVGAASRRLQEHAAAAAAVGSDSSLWEARMRTRELERIMNCVQCNKCRLHGKIAVMGLSTAFQILVGQATGTTGGDFDRIHRVELATLMTTLHKAATAVQFCKEMQEQQHQQQQQQ